jgi:hypothetical protein
MLWIVAAAFSPFLVFPQETQDNHSTLAIVQAGVEESEDAPFLPADYQFMPGDYLYFMFQISGFSVQSFNRDDVHRISLRYQVAPEDTNGVPLTKTISDSIQADLSSEDKNWTPKRRVSFLLPSYIASGDFRVHLTVYDLFGKTEISKVFPFHIGGVRIEPADSVNVQHFGFLRRENDRDALDIPAYNPGDAVFVRFDMAGFKLGPGNAYALDYGLSVVQPSGKIFLDAPRAAELKSASFYPAQYLPGGLRISTPPNSAKGEYIVTLVVHDLIGNARYETRKSFSIE